ncbi:MAG: hypothetical protein ABWZ25_15190 [Chitinophagaceae bacterium]
MRIYLTTIVILLSLSCANDKGQKRYNLEGVSMDIFLNDGLGKSMKDIRDASSAFSKLYGIKDTIIEDEDISWYALVLEDKKNELQAILETSWEKPDTIERIRILSPSITKGNYKVGSEFRDILNEIDTQRLNDFPDGYLGLIARQDQRISFLMDLDFDSPLTRGVYSVNEIPDDLKVKEIILLRR